MARRPAMPTTAELDALAAARVAVEIRWHDSYADKTAAWESRAEVALERPPAAFRSVGILYRATGAWLWLAQSVTPHEVGHALRIPKACVVSVRRLVIAQPGGKVL